MSATIALLPSPPTAHPRSILMFLRQLPSMERAGDDALLALAERIELRRVERGASLWSAGDPASEVIWVRSGVIWLRQGRSQGREVSIGYHGRGALLGMHPGGASAERADDAEVHEDGALLVIRRPAFDAWLAAWPSAVPGVVQSLSELNARMQGRLALIGLHGARARLAGLLLELSRSFGVRDSSGVIIDLRLTHRELAALIGATRETVSVAIVEIRNAGLVRTEQRRVVITDLDGLIAMAEAG
ncbi:MAG TPA: Crp/Fnr family transcriptional regulator [Myxococcota bacterium]|nr:Crp/Fnr family transcriptional regulator [Myxococcota bacterium]